MSIERYLRIVRETSQTKQVIKESKTPVVKEEVKVENPYRSTEQVLGIVQRMMEDARVPQKPRQGPLRPQTGAGKHKDKKKDQKQGKSKHKGKNLDENNIPFAGLGKHKIGQAGQLRSPGPTGYPKGKLVGGAAESRFDRHRDDQFSLGGRMPRTDRIDRDSSSGQDAQQRMERKLKQQTIDRLLDKGFKVDALNGKSLPELIQMLREAVKKPNATTRHLRDYPVSDKDVAKPVKKPEKKKPEQGVAEEKQKGVDGKACWKGYKHMGTKKKGGRTVDNCVKMESISESILSSFGLIEKSPPGFKGTVKAMKKHPELTKGKTKDGKEKNPWALAWHMKNKGYKSHKKADGSDKD